MKKAKTKKHIFILSLMLCVSLFLTACSGGNSESGAVSKQSGEENDSSSQSNEGDKTGEGLSGATGKYVQKDITPVQLQGAEIKEMRQLPTGEMLVIAENRGEMPKAYISTDGEVWEETTPITGAGVLNDYPNHRFKSTLDNNGAWWIAAYTEDGDNHLFYVKDGDAQKVQMPFFESGNASIVLSIQAGSDSTVLISTMTAERVEWTVVDADGLKVTNSFRAADFYPVLTCYSNGKVYGASSSEATFYQYDAQTGNLDEKLAMPISEDVFGMQMCGNFAKDGSFSFVYGHGINKVAPGGSFVQSIVDNRAYAYADSGFSALNIVEPAQDEYWVAGTLYNEDKIYKYYFDENAPAAFAQSISIWAMEDNSFLRYAVSSYAQNNPECDIQVTYGKQAADTGQTDEDIVRAFNASFLAGNVPDVLIMDGLPMDAMVRNGMLSDLSGIVNTADYYENIINCYSENGATYAYPTMFRPQLIMKKKNAAGPEIASINNLEALGDLLVQTDKIYLGGYKPMFNTVYNARQPYIFPENKSVDADELMEFLKVTKRASDAHNLAKNEICPIYGDGDSGLSSSNMDDVIMIDPSLSYFSRDTTATDYAMATLPSYALSTIFMNNHTGEESWPDFAPVPGNTFIPVQVAAVPENAENKEAGKDFVKHMLECQTPANMAHFFPPAFLVKRNTEKEISMARYEETKESFTNAEELNLDGTIEQLTHACSIDTELRAKVYEQAKQLYRGDISIEDAHANIIKNTELYFAEKQ